MSMASFLCSKASGPETDDGKGRSVN
jgi:hypothetical protein